MYRRPVRWLLILLVACAPVVDGPVDKQRVVDRSEGDRLATQLSALPGVVRADVIVRRPVRDPLAPREVVAPATASIVVIVDDQADRATTIDATRRLAGAAVPGIVPAIVVEVGAARPALAKLGPFTIEASSKGPLKIAFALVLALLAAAAGGIAWRARPIRRADLD